MMAVLLPHAPAPALAGATETACPGRQAGTPLPLSAAEG